MADPRFDGVANQPFAQKVPGWYTMEHVGEMKGGTSYTDDPLGWSEDSRWIEFYANQAIHRASPHLARFYLKISGSDAGSMEGSAVRAEMYVDVDSDEKVLSGQAVHAETKLSTTAKGATGYMTALRGILTFDAVSKTAWGGTYGVAFLTLNIGTGITPAARTSFIIFEDLGAVKGNYLFDSANVADATDGIWDADSGAVSTILGYYKVKTADGDGYLVVYAAHD